MTDPFAGVVGHKQALAQLRAQIATDRLAHAYLFVGEAGLGKTTTARLLATSLLPEAPLSRHPDYWEDDRNKLIHVNEIRLIPDKPPEFHELSLQQFLNLKPAVGARRVAVIVNIGRIRDESQPMLLKTLEEPHPHRVIILTTPSLNPFVVLPTVVSRCQRSAFLSVPAPEIESLLREQGVDPERAALLAGLARGRPGWAVRAAGDPDVIERHRAAVAALEAVTGRGREPALRLAAELDSRVAAQEAVTSWQVRLHERMGEGTDAARWATLLERSFDTLGHLEQNVSPRLALEVFLLECARG